jgi:copper homeostasis protein CutC
MRDTDDYRVELCSNLISGQFAILNISHLADTVEGGGLTPSYGLYQACTSQIDPERIMVSFINRDVILQALTTSQIMIRPRIGTFWYEWDEIFAMKEDIKMFRNEDIKGFVFGCLTGDEDVDMHNMKR